MSRRRAVLSADDLHRLNAAVLSIAAADDLDDILRVILEAARELVGARYAAIGVPDSSRQRLERFLSSGLTEEQIEAIGSPPQGHGLLGVMLREGRTVRLSDLTGHPRSVGFPPGHPEMRTFLGVPIKALGHIAGDLYLAEKNGGAEFNQRDELLVELLAEHAAIAIVQAELREVSERRLAGLTALHRAAQAVVQADCLESALDVIVREVRQLVGAEGGAIWLLKDDDPDLVHLARWAGDMGLLTETMPVDGSMAGLAVRTGKPQISNDCLNDARVFRRVKELRSLVMVPLVTSSGTVGALEAANKEGGFGEEDVWLLDLFGQQAAAAVTSARLLEAARRSEERFRELSDNAADLIFTTDRHGALTYVNPAARQMLGYEADRLLGRSVLELVDGRNRTAFARDLRAAATQPGRHVSVRVPARHCNGTPVHLEVRLTGRYPPRAPGVQGIARDITPLVEMEEQLSARGQQLLASHEERATLSAYARLVLQAQEDERKRISRELHDEPLQGVMTLARRLDMLRGDVDRGDLEAARKRLDLLVGMSSDIAAQLRRFSHELRPTMLDDLGLAPALEWLMRNTFAETGLQANTVLEGRDPGLDSMLSTALFRIAQEALSNVRRHSQASAVSLKLRFEPDSVLLCIEDNGVGFEWPRARTAAMRNGRLGLTGMGERAGLVDGTIEVQSAPGKGTRISVHVPITTPS